MQGPLASWERFFKFSFIISLLLAIPLYFNKDRIPNPSYYQDFSLSAPIQEKTDREPFSIYNNDEKYLITPRFNYQLTGVVVSYNDAAQFGNIWHHKRWKDFINVRDLCVLWGNNIKSGVYQRMHFSSDSWTCWASWSKNDSAIFKGTELSNNHLLVDYNGIKKRLLSAEVGDVIELRGVLAAYQIPSSGFFRETSTRRDDNGNGACETIYLDEFEIIKKANPFLRNLYALCKWIAIISLIGLIILFPFTHVKLKH